MSGYVLRLCCAALLCAAVNALCGGEKGLRKLLCSVFLMLTALSPLGELELPELDPVTLQRDAQAAVRSGTEQARDAQARCITEAVEAYVWNKAAGLGLELQVRVELGETLTPKSLVLTGAASPLERQRLTQTLTGELGLGKEAVTWIDPYQSSE